MKAHTVVIGGGAVGLSVAYQLAKRGITDVIVIDKDTLVKGATGRNGGGVRAQWTTAENILLAKNSMKAFQNFAKETGHNIFYRRSGYLFLTRREEQLQQLTKAAAFQREHGVGTRVIDTDEVQRIVPGINTDGVLAATWNPDDAILFPWPLIWGWKDAAEALGVRVLTRTEVTGIQTRAGKIHAVDTSRGSIQCENVVNAAGAWSKHVSEMVDLAMPNYPERHEILVTEPLKPFLDPMLVDLSTGLYLNQDMRGEIIGGLGTHHIESLDWSSSLEFLREFSRQTVNLLPHLSSVKVLRQWAGSYDKTPDHKPVLGVAGDGPSNLYQANGFSGHGMMISPMVGEVTADLIAGRKPALEISGFLLDRFKGEIEVERMVIG
ncbi:MAG: NAD(P)/FAD-dependent oxidoreductase [Thermoplasmatota archaeon]